MSRFPTPKPPTGWARDFLLASDPNTPGAQLADLVLVGAFGEDFEKLRPNQLAIIRALAKNPNTPRDVLALLSEKFWHDVKENPALPILALEDPDWCKRSLHNDLLMISMPNLWRAWCKEQDDAYYEATRGGPREDDDEPITGELYPNDDDEEVLF